MFDVAVRDGDEASNEDGARGEVEHQASGLPTSHEAQSHHDEGRTMRGVWVLRSESAALPQRHTSATWQQRAEATGTDIDGNASRCRSRSGQGFKPMCANCIAIELADDWTQHVNTSRATHAVMR